MSKTIASKATVHAAADGLKARGMEPTFEKIVDVLGGGSNSTIGPHLESWRQSAKPPSRPIPETVDTRAKVFLEAVWAAALTVTQADIDLAGLASSARINEAERALAASIEISHGLEADRDRLLEKVTSLREQCIEFRYQLLQVESLKAALEAAERLAEQRREACEALTRELFALKCVNDTLKLHGQELLAQVSMRLTKPRNKVSTAQNPTA